MMIERKGLGERRATFREAIEKKPLFSDLVR